MQRDQFAIRCQHALIEVTCSVDGCLGRAEIEADGGVGIGSRFKAVVDLLEQLLARDRDHHDRRDDLHKRDERESEQ